MRRSHRKNKKNKNQNIATVGTSEAKVSIEMSRKKDEGIIDEGNLFSMNLFIEQNKTPIFSLRRSPFGIAQEVVDKGLKLSPPRNVWIGILAKQKNSNSPIYNIKDCGQSHKRESWLRGQTKKKLHSLQPPRFEIHGQIYLSPPKGH